jgi:pyruvate-formate lyase-activating enzyme
MATTSTSVSAESRPRASSLPFYGQLQIAYSDLCNASCPHCIANAGPHGRLRLPKHKAFECIEAAAELGLTVVGYTGGEIFLHYDDLCDMMRHAHERGVYGLADSNGSWATSFQVARQKLERLKGHGLRFLRLSADNLHQARVPLQRVIHALKAASELGIYTSVTICFLKDDPSVLATVATISKHTKNVKTRNVGGFGRATALPAAQIIRHPLEQLSGRCSGIGTPAVNQQGRVSVCCAPPLYLSDEAAQSSPLVLGSIDQEPLTDIIMRARKDPFLHFIADKGFTVLVDKLNTLEEGFYQPKPQGYTGNCELCLDLLAQPSRVARIRALLPALLGEGQRH